MRPPVIGDPRSELARVLATCRTSYAGVAVFTAILNVLYLTGSFFMLQVYDRVLPSRSVPTQLPMPQGYDHSRIVLDRPKIRIHSRDFH